MKIKRLLVIVLLIIPFFLFNFKSEALDTVELDNVNFTNLLVFAKFKDETEFIDDDNKGSTIRELVNNMYNESCFSVKDYFYQASGKRVKIKSLFLYDKNGNSITLSKERGYYAEKSDENPIGYEANEENYRFAELQRDWSDTINSTIDDGGYISDYDGIKHYSFSELDKNNDGYIDSINILYKKSPMNISVSWSSPLWNYQTECYDIEVNYDSRIIRSNKYLQVTVKDDPVYTDSIGKKIMSVGTITHEMGHIFGLKDLYSSSDKTAVGFMSLMGTKLTPVPQNMSIKEKEALGWLSPGQLEVINKPGQYTLNAIKDDNEAELIGYKCNIGNGYTLYLEYRNFASNGSRFDNKNKELYDSPNVLHKGNYLKSGLVCYLAKTDIKFPSNLNVSGKNWQFQVLGGQYGTRNDSALALYENYTIDYSNVYVEVISITDDKLTFSIEGEELESQESVSSIEFSNPPSMMSPNDLVKLEASIIGTNISKNAKIEYSISNNSSANTKIDENGNLVIASDENSLYITVVATYNGVSNSINIKINHNLMYIPKTDSTCVSTGIIEHYYCSICDKCFLDDDHLNEITNIIIPKLDHVEEIITGVDPDCINTGLTSGKKCSICGEIIEEQKVIPAKGHKEAIVLGRPASCEASGLTEGKICSVCNTILEKQEIIPATGHSEVLIKGKSATCEDEGITDGYKCQTCNKTIEEQKVIPAKGHKEAIVLGRPANCEVSGLTEGKICSVCNTILEKQEIIPATGHKYGEWIIIKEATETMTGLKQKECIECHNIVTDIIPKIPHTHTYTILLVNPTCKTVGYTLYTCGCGYSKKDNIVPALGHNIQMLEEIKPTCMDTGLTSGLKCSICGEIIEEQKIIPAKGHKETIVIGIPASCESSGLTEGKICSVCNIILEEQEIIPMLKHEESDWIIDVLPTTSKEGKKHKECINCNRIIESQSIPIIIDNKRNIIATTIIISITSITFIIVLTLIIKFLKRKSRL